MTVNRRWLWLLCAIVAAAAVAAVLVPVWIIQPFRPQSPRALEFALLLRRLSPFLTVAAVLLVAFAAMRLWRASRWWSKGLLAAMLLLVSGTVWAARQNHFEWMFQPLHDANYAIATATTFVDDADLVIAVERNGETAAYPVRQLAYHHIVQDVVGHVPIAVTY
jgi:hypothetical protein